MFLRQSTSQVIRFGPFLDSTDGVTAETGLTIAQADMQLSKDGGAYAQKNTTGNATHDTDGWYSTTLDTTDTATVGELYMQVVVAGALPVWVRYWVLEETVYDGLYGASAAGYIQTTEFEARTLAAASYFDPATDTVANVTTVATTTTNTDMRGTDSAATAAALSAVDGKIDDIQGATFSSATDSLEAIRDRGDAAWVTGAGGSSPTVEEIRAEIDSNSTQLAAIVGDTNELQADWANGGRLDLILDARASQVSVDTIDGNVDSVLADTGTTIPAQITGLNNIAATDIVSGGAIDTTGGSIDNVTLVDTTTANTDMRGTDSALLASSAPTNWSSLVITAGGAVDALTQGYLNTLMTETTAGRVAGNFSVFYDNADAVTTNVVDDVGGGGGSSDWTTGERNEIRGRLGITGTTASGGNTPTLSTQASVDTVGANVDAVLVDTGTTLPSQISGLNNVAATDIVSNGAITTLSGAVANVDLVDTLTTYTGNTPQTGDAFDRLGAPVGVSISADIAVIDSNVDNLNNVSVADILTTQMAEAYAADGTAPTLAQAIFLIQQTIGDFSISGTTLTARQLDGSTTAATYTLDDASSPTSRTRTT